MLRPYQRDTLAISKQRFAAGVNRQLVVLPTGTGKTVVFANLPKHHGIANRVMPLVHREELAQQAADKIKKWNPDYSVGVEMADSYASDWNKIVVGSVPTLGRTNSKRLERFDPDQFGAIVCDEAHHSVSSSWMNVLEHFRLTGNEPDKSRLLLGVTATPSRGDSAPLGQLYDEIIYQMSILDAIRQGWLVDIKGVKVGTNVSLEGVHTYAGDFNQGELGSAVNVDERNHLIVQSWLRYGDGRPTVAFTVDVAHAKQLAATFQAYGIGAQAIWADDPARRDKLAAHRGGHLKVITNCGILTEGYDDWRISCIIMARPTKSQLLFVQMAGRGTRIQDNINNLVEAKLLGHPAITKPDMLLIDVVDNTERHSLVTLASIFGLAGKLDLNNKSVTKAIEKLERARSDNPDIDFGQLKTVDDLDAYIEHVNLFENKWPEEVEANSLLQWHKRGDGEYVLLLPKGEKVTLKQNLLDKWDIMGTVQGNTFAEQNVLNLPEAFRCADNFVTMFGRGLLTLLRRKSKWREEPASNPQKGLVRRLYRYNPTVLKVLDQLTKGQANKLIDDFHRAKGLA